MSKNIVVLGGLGYIGRRVVESLIIDNNVSVVDLGVYGGDSWNFAWAKSCGVSLLLDDYYSYESLCKIAKADVVILLAGHSSVGSCTGSPSAGLNAFKNNVSKFADLLDILTIKQTLIYASSASIYGNQPPLLLPETTDPQVPKNAYDMTKSMIDMYAANHMNLKSSPRIVGLRLGTVCGPSSNFRTDLMLNSMTLSAIRSKIVNYTSPYCYRSILGVRDLTVAIKSIVDLTPDPGVYNLASFGGTSEYFALTVSDMTDAMLCKGVGNPSPYNFLLSTVKAKEAFGFKPEETAESIVEDIIKLLNDPGDTYFGDRSKPFTLS